MFYYEFFKDQEKREGKSKKNTKSKGDDLDDSTFLAEGDDESDDNADATKEDADDAPDSDQDSLDEDDIMAALEREDGPALDSQDEDDFDMEAAMAEFGSDDGEDESEVDDDSSKDILDENEDEDEDEDDDEIPNDGQDVDEDGLTGGAEADVELASMFMDEEESAESGSEADEEALKSTKGKPGKPHSKKITKLAEKATNLGYTGDYFKSRLKSLNGMDEDGSPMISGGAFASFDDFQSLIEGNNDDEDTGEHVSALDEIKSSLKSKSGGNKRKRDANSIKKQISKKQKKAVRK
jgi:hypothetical protein